MNADPPQVSGWWRRTEVRLALFGLAAVGAVFLGFLAVSVTTAGAFIKRGGYFVMLFTFVLWVAALWRLARSRGPLAWGDWRKRTAVALVIAFFTLLAVAHEKFHSKILYDEFVLQSTAYNMHYFREVGVMVRGYEIQGVFISTDNYLDKRPYLFPFLISLFHDLTGYRAGNVFWLNALLCPVALALVYTLGRQLSNWLGGLLAIVLLGSLPLFAQNATGAGMELINLVMLLGTIACGTLFLARPGEDELSAFVLSAVLLAQARYESAVYILPAGLLILLGWWRANRIVLSWPAMLAPLLLVPVALQNRVISNSPLLWELREGQSTRFSLDYLKPNLQGAAHFLFSTAPEQSNSLLLVVLGGLAMGWFVWRAIRFRPRLAEFRPCALPVLFFGAGILANTMLIMFYYWASFDDPMASRFSLPFHLLLVFATVYAAGWWEGRLPALRILLLAAVVCTFGFSLPKQAHHFYSNVGINEIDWELRVLAALPPVPRIIISNKSTLPWLVEKIPSILIGRSRMVADRIAYQLQNPGLNEVLVLQSLRPSTLDGDFQLLPEEKLPAWFKLETIAERRFGAKISRVSRLVAVELPADYASPLAPKPDAPGPGTSASRTGD